jgi:pyridoxal kinase
MLSPGVSAMTIVSISRFGVQNQIDTILTATTSLSHIPDVGNKAAVFPLQLLGFDVDVINSVHFSNHTGYPLGWEGDVLDGATLLKLVDGLERNGLLSDDSIEGSNAGRIGHVLTGYIGSESFLRSVVNVVQKIRASNSKCRYVCDPVLGDGGKFYVPEELVDIYRKDVLPLVSLNSFMTMLIFNNIFTRCIITGRCDYPKSVRNGATHRSLHRNNTRCPACLWNFT